MNKILQKRNLYLLPTTLLLAIALLLSGFCFAPKVPGWGTSPTGSVKYLDGSTVLVSLFIDAPEADWTQEKKDMVTGKMNLANDYLVAAGNSYGKTVNLIYNIQEHPDLCYMVPYSKKIDDSDDTSYDLLDYVTKYIDTNIPTEDILNQYGVDSIGYMCYLDSEGTSFTFPFYEDDADIYYYETCFLYIRCDGDNEPPAVYAHEILHMFGARDLYATDESDGITKDFVQHIETTYPNEIMLTTYDENWENVQDHVSNDLTDITAYFIGWIDTIPELEQYPSIRSKNRASFAVTDAEGDYSDYTMGDPDSYWDSDHSSTSGTSGSSTASGSHWGSGSSGSSGSTSDSGDDDFTIWDLIWIILWFLFGD